MSCPHYMGFTRAMCPKCYAEDRDEQAYQRVAAKRGETSKPSIDEFMDMVRKAGEKRGRKPS